MRGTIDKVIRGKYFFIIGEDGNRYFAAFEELERKGKKYIWKGNQVSFLPVTGPVEEDKTPRARDVVPDDKRNPALDQMIPTLDSEKMKQKELKQSDAENAYATTHTWLEGTITDIKGGKDALRAFCIVKGDRGEEFFAPFMEIIEYTKNRRNIKTGKRVMFIPKAPDAGSNGRRRVATRIVFI